MNTMVKNDNFDLTDKIIKALGWSIFEYPEEIPDQDENGFPTTSEISFYGIKKEDGTVYYKGSPFKDELYKALNINSMHFLGIILTYLAKNKYVITMAIMPSSVSVSLGRIDSNPLEIIRKEGSLSDLPRLVTEVFISFLEKS